MSAGLRSLAAHLQRQGLALRVVVDDDTVAALAVAAGSARQLQQLCTVLAIPAAPGLG